MGKVIGRDVRFYIRADKVTRITWDYIKKSFRAIYNSIQEAIKRQGVEKVIIGFTDDMKPVCTILDLH